MQVFPTSFLEHFKDKNNAQINKKRYIFLYSLTLLKKQQNWWNQKSDPSHPILITII